jgi:ABC-2 type transport system ATP-binding protein
MSRKVIGTLSRGFRQRVGLADALVAEPPILLLDEPTAGLDPVQVREFRELLDKLAGEPGRTVLFCSHVLAEVEAVARRVVMLAGGRVVGDGDLAELQRAAGNGEQGTLEDAFVALARGEKGKREEEEGTEREGNEDR